MALLAPSLIDPTTDDLPGKTRKSGGLHAASLAKSTRLQRVLEVLKDGLWHSTRDLIRQTGSCAINSVVAELRANGKTIDCRQHGRIHEYRLVQQTGQLTLAFN
jgi:hypothetical protein